MKSDDDSPRVVLITAPDEQEGKRIGRELVERRLVACVNVVSGLTSIYRWEGAVTEDAEALLVCKTKASCVPALEAALSELHPYDVFECVSLEVSHVEARYLAWLRAETGTA